MGQGYRFDPQGRGASGIKTRRDVGDFGIGELRRRDQTIIDSMKLARAQDVERRRDQINQQRNVDAIEEGISEDIEGLKQKYFQNRLAAVKLRGRQEGQKGKDEARFLREEGNAAAKKWTAIGNLATAISTPLLKDWVENKKEEIEGKAYDQTTKAITDGAHSQNINKVGELGFQKNWTIAEQTTYLSGLNDAGQMANTLMSSDGWIAGLRGHNGVGKALFDNNKRFISNAINRLQQEEGLILTQDFIEEYLDKVKLRIGRVYGVIDSEGEVSSNKQVQQWSRAFEREKVKILDKWIVGDSLRKNTEVGNTIWEDVILEKSPESVMRWVQNWKLRPLDDDPLRFHDAGSGYREAFKRMASSKDFLDLRSIDRIGNGPVFNLKTGKPSGEIDKKTGEQITIYRKFPGLRQEVRETRKAWNKKWKENADIDRNTLIEATFTTLIPQYLDGKKELTDANLDADINEYTQLLGGENRVVTALKMLKKGGKEYYDSNIKKQRLIQAAENYDHQALLDILYSTTLTATERKEWIAEYLPLANMIEQGFNFKAEEKEITNLFKRLLEGKSTSDLDPETLRDAVKKALVLKLEKYEELTLGKINPTTRQREDAAYEVGSPEALKAVNDWFKNKLNDENGPFAITPSSKRPGNLPAEFTNFMDGLDLPDGLDGKPNINYQLNSTQWAALVQQKGRKAAILEESVLSKGHLERVAAKIQAGKPFKPLGITRNKKANGGLTSQEIYQHHLDREFGKGKFIVPEDPYSAFLNDSHFNEKQQEVIERVRTRFGFHKTVETMLEPKPVEGDKGLTPLNNATLNSFGLDMSNYNSNGSWGVDTLIKKGLVGDLLPPVEEEPEQDFNFTSPDFANLFAYAVNNGLDITKVNQIPDPYEDIINTDDADTLAWLRDNNHGFIETYMGWIFYG